MRFIAMTLMLFRSENGATAIRDVKADLIGKLISIKVRQRRIFFYLGQDLACFLFFLVESVFSFFLETPSFINCLILLDFT